MPLSITTRAGKGSPLSDTEMDDNLTVFKAAIEALQGVVLTAEGIASVTSDGTSFTITGTEGTVWGPFTLPRGATITSGTAVPSNGSGANGDFYLRTTTGDIYLKSGGAWAVATNLFGVSGGGITIEYTFDTTTTSADPGNGKLRLNNATQNTAVAIYADLLDVGGSTWTTVLDSLAGSSSTVKGHIRLVNKYDRTKWLLFTISAVVTQSGYRELTVANVSGSAASPFSNADTIVFTFSRTGDKGDTGAAGTNGTNGSNGNPGGAVTLQYTFSTTTSNSDPGNGTLRLNNATGTSATAIYADLLDALGSTVTSVLDTFDGSTSTVKAHIRLTKQFDETKWLLFTLSARITQTGYREFTVSNVAGSTNSPFSNGDTILLKFSRTGDKGDTGATGSPYVMRKNTFSPSAAAVTIDWSATDEATVTLTDASTAVTFTGALDGQKCMVRYIQGSGGNKVLTGPSNAGYGSDITGQPILSTTAGKEDYLAYIYEQTPSKYRLVGYVRGYS